MAATLLEVWHEPIPGHLYVLGGDPAEGLEHGNDSALCVLDVTDGVQVAQCHGRIEPITFGQLCGVVGTWYNTAWVAIENNKDGGANRVLFNSGYANIYYEQADRGKAYTEQTPKLGFNSNYRTKNTAIALARKLLQDRSVVIRSHALFAQMETYALDGVSFNAVAGAKDDLVSAFVFACHLFNLSLLRATIARKEEQELLEPEPVEEPVPLVERLIQQTQRRRLVSEYYDEQEALV